MVAAIEARDRSQTKRRKTHFPIDAVTPTFLLGDVKIRGKALNS